jgi:hypothetical protein
MSSKKPTGIRGAALTAAAGAASNATTPSTAIHAAFGTESSSSSFPWANRGEGSEVV